MNSWRARRIAKSFPWHRVHLFWGDERFVPHSDARSNFRMAQEALLSHVPIEAANVHPIPTEGTTPDNAARAYERTLKSFYGADELDPARPLFDVTLLGLGEDGHTASLFPKTRALTERERWVVAVTEGVAEPRISLTYPPLEAAAMSCSWLPARRSARSLTACVAAIQICRRRGLGQRAASCGWRTLLQQAIREKLPSLRLRRAENWRFQGVMRAC